MKAEVTSRLIIPILLHARTVILFAEALDRADSDSCAIVNYNLIRSIMLDQTRLKIAIKYWETKSWHVCAQINLALAVNCNCNEIDSAGSFDLYFGAV